MEELESIMDEQAEALENSDSREELDAIPALPEGIGLSYDEVKMLLAMKHDTSISLDDPILMLVTINNAFIAENQKLLDRHNKALTGVMAAQTGEYVKAVKQTAEDLSKTLSEASIEGMKKLFEEHLLSLASSKTNTRWCTAIIVTAALANLFFLILRQA